MAKHTQCYEYPILKLMLHLCSPSITDHNKNEAKYNKSMQEMTRHTPDTFKNQTLHQISTFLFALAMFTTLHRSSKGSLKLSLAGPKTTRAASGSAFLLLRTDSRCESLTQKKVTVGNTTALPITRRARRLSLLCWM